MWSLDEETIRLLKDAVRTENGKPALNVFYLETDDNDSGRFVKGRIR